MWLDDDRLQSQPPTPEASRQLSIEERERQSRYLTPELKARFGRRRNMLRQTLSHYRPDVAPGQWRLGYNAQGRPWIHPDQCRGELHFNLSHSKNLTLLAIASQYEIGVDIEHTMVEPGTNHLDVAEHYFTPSECRWIHGAQRVDRLSRFFDLWTLKESYIKARGLGLSLPLNHFQFAIAHDHVISLEERVAATATRQNWKFELGTPAQYYRYAVALQCSGREYLSVQRFKFEHFSSRF